MTTVLDRDVMILGGSRDGVDNILSTIEIFDTYSRSMVGTVSKNPSLVKPKMLHTVNVIRDTLHVARGWNNVVS